MLRWAPETALDKRIQFQVWGCGDGAASDVLLLQDWIWTLGSLFIFSSALIKSSSKSTKKGQDPKGYSIIIQRENRTLEGCCGVIYQQGGFPIHWKSIRLS